MKMKPNFLLVLFLAFIQLTLAQKTQKQFMAFSTPDSLTKNADAVVRLYDTEIELKSPRKMNVKIRKAVTIFNKNGNDNAELVFYYDKAKRIKNINIYIYNSLGIEEKKVKNKEIKDYSAADGFSLFNDNRLKYYDYVPLSYPYTIYYEYEYETSNTAFIPRWSPIGSYDQGIESSNYTFTYAPGFNIQKSEKNLDKYNIEKKITGNTIAYSAKNITPIQVENFSPSVLEMAPIVILASDTFHLEGVDGKASNWDEFGKWMYRHLLASRMDLPKATKEKIKQLVNGVDDPVERAKIVYDYVQKKTRYISIQVGVGGWMPMLASDVDNLGYGDCKALTNYTKTLMDAAGVESYYTAVYADSERTNIEKEVVSVQGNHVFLYIPSDEKDIWLECTSQDVPFGYQGTFTDDRDVLVISSNGGKIKHTGIYKEEDSYQKTDAACKITANGSLEANISIRSAGVQYKNHYLLNTKNKREITDYYKSDYWTYINNLTIKDYQFDNDKDAIVFTEKLNVAVTDYAKFTGNRIMFEVNVFNKSKQIPNRYRNRKMPIEVSRGFLDEDVFSFFLPDGYTIEAMPQNIKLKTKFGTYTATIEKLSDTEIKYSRSFLFRKGTYPKEDYNAFRNFLKDIAKYDNSKIVLIKSQP